MSPTPPPQVGNRAEAEAPKPKSKEYTPWSDRIYG